ncbi:hypothetical protein CEXT_190661 [Caerostris extrusa]|uniref:Uncharacterized protein n=1 Tax=Caerostris extrusa TaxID=172846 RepID=A0AAV4RWK9_CAEEX|nr:hypothetical protein CEXT_190661 [Caerostris extrusa]
METGDITKSAFANEFAYFRYRCSMCHRLPWTLLNIPSFWTVPLNSATVAQDNGMRCRLPDEVSPDGVLPGEVSSSRCVDYQMRYHLEMRCGLPDEV